MVSSCSLAAQGLWLNMMMIAHDSDRYGYLSMNGVAIPPGSIARKCGCTLEQYTTLLAELDSVGVPSRTRDGIIFSRRMVRDAAARKEAAQRQSRRRSREDGTESRETPPLPNFCVDKSGDPVDNCHADVTPMSQRSSSSSSLNSKEPPTPVDNSRAPPGFLIKKINLKIVQIQSIDQRVGADAERWAAMRARRGESAENIYGALGELQKNLLNQIYVHDGFGYLNTIDDKIRQRAAEHEHKHGDLAQLGAIMRRIGRTEGK
jgi:hypothetical protein